MNIELLMIYIIFAVHKYQCRKWFLVAAILPVNVFYLMQKFLNGTYVNGSVESKYLREYLLPTNVSKTGHLNDADNLDQSSLQCKYDPTIFQENGFKPKKISSLINVICRYSQYSLDFIQLNSLKSRLVWVFLKRILSTNLEVVVFICKSTMAIILFFEFI